MRNLASPTMLGLALLVVLAAGCTDQEALSAASVAPDARTQAPYAPAAFSEDSGGLEGTVTDDSFLPLAGVDVVILDLDASTVSDDEGRFSFSLLRPGTLELAAQRLGYESVGQPFVIQEGQVTRITLKMTPLPVEEPFHVTHEKAGRMGCAYAHRSPTPVYPRSYTDACGHANRFSGVRIFNVDFQTEFKLSNGNTSRLAGLVFETTWRANQASANGLDVPWGLSPALFNFGEPTGRSPLYHVANRTVIKAVSDGYPTFCLWHGPCPVWAATYPFPETLGPSYPADVTFVFDQPFTHFVTEFVFEDAPIGFSALADQ